MAVSLAVLGIVLSAPLVLSAAQVVPLSLDETVRQADSILLGSVVGRQSRWGDASRRWIVTDYTLAVEETLFRSELGETIGATVLLTYWGGTIGDETQAISDLRVPAVGERLLVMLRPGWARQIEFSPVVGLNQGLFSVVAEGASAQREARLVVDAGGRRLALAADGRMTRETATAGLTTGVSLLEFRTWLAAHIVRIKASRPAISPLVSSDADGLMPIFEKTPLIAAAVRGRHRAPVEQTSERSQVSDIGAAIAPYSGDLAPVTPSIVAQGPAVLDYVTIGPKPNLPIVVNNFPSSFAPWSPEDEYQMSKWNYYVADVFHVTDTPTNTFAWGDRVFDLAGWVSSATLQSVYGIPWGSGTIGVTFYRWTGSTVIEADIALNPAFSFTLDDESVYSGTSAQGFRHVLLHELGHMLGLDHDFFALSVMNYLPSVFRSFALPYSDDVAGIRALYPANVVDFTDLGVNLYYASGYQQVAEASYPSSVLAGGPLTVNHYTVENAGNFTIEAPIVAWYLTPARHFDSAYYFLGTATYGPALPPFGRYTPSSVQRTFTVPASVPSGYYYLAANIPAGGGASQSSFPFSNNYAFSRRLIFVGSQAPAAPTLVSPANNSVGVSLPPTLTWTGSATATSYDVYLSTSSSPAFYASTASTSLSVATLSAGTTYHWYVVARGSAGSAASSTFVFTTTATLTTPTLLSPANNVTGTIRIPALSWSGSSGATSYDIYFGTAPSPPFYGSTPSTSITVGPLAGGIRYYWSIVARNGSVASPATAIRSFTTSANLNIADIVLRHTQTGDVAGWLMNGPALSQGGIIYSGLSSAWRIDGVGDLNADGRSDIVFRNAQTGDVAAWLMNGLTVAHGAIVYTGLPASWQIAGIGDLNGDGSADLVFRHVETGDMAGWLMDGVTLVHGAIFYSALPAAWQIASTGDLNGDGKVDLVLRNTQTHDVAGWLMNGLALAQSGIIYSNLPPDWQIATAGDLNGDRMSDLVFRHAQTGDVAAWLMNGLMLSQGQIIYVGLPAAWQIKGMGDLDGDGKADLVFDNALTGEMAAWIMHGLGLAQGAIFYSGLPAAWQFEGMADLDMR